jgi:hypothetical protein
MTQEPKDELPVDRKALLEPAENFRVLLDIDGKQFGVVLTALNRKSMVALLQFILIVNPKRVTGYVVRTESAIIGGAGELVAAVPAGQYVSQMVAHSRLKDPAPKEPPSVELPFWNTFQIKPKDQTMPDNSKKFIAEMVIDGVAEKFPVTGANEDSVIALFTAATCAQMPRINGWNLYSAEDGKMIASVPAMLFLAKLAEISPLGKTPADPKSAGWRALPAIAPTSEEFQKSIEAAKKAGKTST